MMPLRATKGLGSAWGSLCVTATAHLRLVPPPPPAVDPRIGEEIDGRYLIEKVLGQGGMGMVYLARHRALDKSVAVKVLKPDVSKDEQILARFEREARAASAIGSPHICDVSDFGTLADGSTYFVMEMLDGPSLAKVISDGAPLPATRIVDIAKQLCDALGAAHAAGIVHRDLKPDNVHLVARGGGEFVKVLDFGIAKMAGTTETKLTVAGQVFGTPHYMSPEQCAGYDVDARTDVYALGVMLYEMACGRLPFESDSLMGLLTKHVYEQPIPPRDLGLSVEVPSGLESIILCCLAKQPAARYTNMAALRADLEAFERNQTPRAVFAELDRNTPSQPRAALPVARPAPAVAAPAPTKPRAWARLAGVAALVIAVGVGAGVALWPAPSVAVAAKHAPAKVAEVVEDEPPREPLLDRFEVAPAPSRVTLHTDPEGAEVFGPDGVLIGNTPVDVPRPAEGEAPIAYTVRLARHRERTVPVGATTADELTLRLDRERGGSHRVDPVGTPTETDPSDHVDGFDTLEPVESDLIDPFTDPANPPRTRRPR
ncbi:MAG: serine/threonine protein kinase [Sandaracinaceae bacterium]|nr:serine/threonine protein kinase [Sandaracinaceae bacterium]